MLFRVDFSIATGRSIWTMAIGLLISTLSLNCSTSFAQEAAVVDASADKEKVESKEKAERQAWTKYYTHHLKNYKFIEKEDEKKTLKATPKAMLRWDNPVRVGRTHGELFVWTQKGRGVLVGNIFSYDIGDGLQRNVSHEFHSFHDQPIACKYSNASDFESTDKFELDAGVEYHEIMGAAPPAKKRALRLAQMRLLAKQFKAESKNKDVTQPLRMLTKPLFRFDTKDVDDDGAIFAYVTGTDPELLIAIITRKVDGAPKWLFGAGRFSDLPLSLKHKNKVVWEFGDRRSYAGGYYAQHGITQQPQMPNVQSE